jgi:hypothetical protein
VIAVSRQKYGTPKAVVEDAIRHWYNVDSVVAGVNANEGENPIVLAGREKKANTEPLSEPTSIAVQDPQEDNENRNKNNNNDEGSKKKKKKKRSGELTSQLDILEKEREGKLPDDPERRKVLEYLESKADYIVRHKDRDDKYVFLPEHKPDFAIPDYKGRHKGTDYKKNGNFIYKVKIDMFEPQNHEIFGKNKAPDIWVGTVQDMVNQLEAIAEGVGGATKFLGIEDKTKDHSVLQNIIQKKKEGLNKEGLLKDKLDKESLKQLIREVAMPREKTIEPEKQSAPETIVEEKPVIETVEKIDREEPKEPKPVAEPIKEETAKPVFEDGKVLKEISADNFHKVKTIHPHERVKITEDIKEIKPGETIRFD